MNIFENLNTNMEQFEKATTNYLQQSCQHYVLPMTSYDTLSYNSNQVYLHLVEITWIICLMQRI